MSTEARRARRYIGFAQAELAKIPDIMARPLDFLPGYQEATEKRSAAAQVVLGHISQLTTYGPQRLAQPAQGAGKPPASAASFDMGSIIETAAILAAILMGTLWLMRR